MSDLNLSQDVSDQNELRRPEVARPNGGSQNAIELSRNVSDSERLLSGAAGAVLGLVALGGTRGITKLALTTAAGYLIYRAVSGYCPIYSSMGVNTLAPHPATPEDYFDYGIHIECATHINKPASELYSFWRDFTHLPQVMSHLKNVETLSPTRSRWTTAGPLGTSVSWEAEIIHDQPHQLIAWKSVENSVVDNAGSVRFIPHGDDLTEVRVVLDYIPPGGRLGQAVAHLFGEDADQQVAADLQRFKSQIESREMPAPQSQRTEPVAE
jgi:uncharacterized membrane protein